MFGSFSRSFKLFKESWSVLRQDPELVWLTIASFFSVGLIIVLFIGIGFSNNMIVAEEDAESITSGGVFLIVLAYFLCYFSQIYFQVALVSAVMHRMDGYDPSIRFAINQANHRLFAILVWTLIAATVGLIIKAIEEGARRRGSGIGASIIVMILGASWNLLVFFVIPVIVAENKTGISAIKQSGKIIKERWGSAIIGNQGIGLLVFIAVLLTGAGPIALGVFAIDASFLLGALLILLGILSGMTVAAIGSTLSSTYRAVLYRYATAGEIGQYHKEILDSAFRPSSDLRQHQ
ncbi:MAG: hypothetical protein CL777_04290 [Chloroflexi bacterium]|nr:hypothetical protein [Chloroflexota bacterium]